MSQVLYMKEAEIGTAGYEQKLDQLASALRDGEVISLPTDTVWGVAALEENGSAVKAIFDMKHRDLSRSLPAFVAGVESAGSLLQDFPEPFARLAKRYWPGGLTLVGIPRPGKLENVRAPDGTVALRVPDTRLVQEILRKLDGAPLACTSANRTGRPPLLDALQVARVLCNGPVLIANNDEPSSGLPSTVVALRDGEAVIVREGSIPSGEILEVAGSS